MEGSAHTFGGFGGFAVTGSPTEASDRVDALRAGVRRQTDALGDVRRHALAVTLLSWDSPAGSNFRAYLSDRCAEISRTIDDLEAAGRQLEVYGRFVREAEVLRGGGIL